jgi:glycosyltransferase involved in cell wall biosynthesis
MSKRYIIADWLVHGGHQYEFFKTGHDFFCANPDGSAPDPKSLGRPINENVKYVKQSALQEKRVSIIMVRSPIKAEKYKRLRGKYAFNKPPGIAVVQTTKPFVPPEWVRCVVWNSEHCMKLHSKAIGWAKHFYIPHGFDPNEFSNLGLQRNGKMLGAGSLYRQRDNLLGYREWRWVADRLKDRCALIGHGNDDPESIGSHSLDRLVKTYNEHSVFLNTTKHSAMPRTRAEAMMCGMPLVSTANYGIEKYLINGKNCIIANDKQDMLYGVKKILDSPSMQEDFSLASRETALKYFHINEYLNRWKQVFEEALK